MSSFQDERGKRKAKLDRPPLTPPADAEQAPAGVRWQLVENGHESPVGEHDALTADVTVWKADGTLATSTFDRDYAGSIMLSSVGAEFQELLKRLKAPAVARYWIPKAAHTSWHPPAWPDEDVIVQVDAYTVSRSNEPLAAQAPKPAASGPPANAATAPNGYKYQVLQRGADHAVSASRPLTLVWTGWVVEGLVVRRAHRNERTETTLKDLPGGLADVVRGMQVGETRRVWIPKARAGEVAPDAKGLPLIIDLSVQQKPG